MLRHAEDWAYGFLAGATTVSLIGVAGAAFVLLVHVHLKSDRHHSSQEDCCEDSAARRHFGLIGEKSERCEARVDRA
jgi:hypothetical protein